MFYANPKEITSLLLAVKYTHAADTICDYSNEPRPCHNIAFILEGEGIVTANGKSFSLRPKDILYIPQNTTYTATWLARPKAVFRSLHFSFQPKHDPLAKKNIPVQVVPYDRFEEAYELLKEIEKAQYAKDEQSFLLLASFYKLCGELLPHIEAEDDYAKNSAIEPALSYLNRNYKKKISVQQLASLCFLSPSRFFYLFKEQTGTSPILYKNKLALQYAAQELLASPEKNIASVANAHGFRNLIYFERLFKKTTGKTPSQYRKEERLL